MIRQAALPLMTAILSLATAPAVAAGAQEASKNPVKIANIKTDPPVPDVSTKDIRFILKVTNKGTVPVPSQYAMQGIRFYCGGQGDPCEKKKKEPYEPPNSAVNVSNLYPGEAKKVTFGTGQWPAGTYYVYFFLDPVSVPSMQMDSQFYHELKVSPLTAWKSTKGTAPLVGAKPRVPPTATKVPFLIFPAPLATQPGGRRMRAPSPTPTPLPGRRKG